MELKKLEEFNHWWIEKNVDSALALEFKRDVYSDMKKELNNRFIISISGLRRVGKTTLMYQLIEDLLSRGVSLENVFFFSFDEVNVNFSEVIDSYREFQEKNFRKEKVYIFLDEIQKCDNWENELKKYYDLYPKLKFIITGSESLFIKKKTKESLAGRVSEFVLKTFSFKEFLRFRGVSPSEFKYEKKIKPLFVKFIKNGGFPETFDLDYKKYSEYLRALVVDKIVFRDIPNSFKLDDAEFLKTLLELISCNPGMYVDYQSISKQFGKDRRVIKNYISYLQESFLISLLGNYRRGTTSLRKNKRAYPNDTGLIALYFSSIDGILFSKMVESFFVVHLGTDAFWKDNLEVDIVKGGFPVEIKYKENIRSEDFKSLRAFMKKFDYGDSTLVTKKEEGKKVFDEGTVKMVPAWKFALKMEESLK
jgi:uncharacterized protein